MQRELTLYEQGYRDGKEWNAVTHSDPEYQRGYEDGRGDSLLEYTLKDRLTLALNPTLKDHLNGDRWIKNEGKLGLNESISVQSERERKMSAILQDQLRQMGRR